MPDPGTLDEAVGGVREVEASASIHMPFVWNDGGRLAADFKGNAGDCVVRAVAIATSQPYREVYDALSNGARTQRKTKRGRAKSSARDGVNTRRKWFKDYMAACGWRWVPTMGIGTGCTVHLAAGELPPGRLIVAVSKHYTAVIDGVVHDTWDPQRTTHEIGAKNGERYTRAYERCVYGYWIANSDTSHSQEIPGCAP